MHAYASLTIAGLLEILPFPKFGMSLHVRVRLWLQDPRDDQGLHFHSNSIPASQRGE